MKLIAHRGNINGPDISNENNPKYIENAIIQGFNVEIDLRYIDSKLYLGHDSPDYEIEWTWLEQYKENLWIHCKNLRALYNFSSKTNGYNYFWHQDDKYTLTSTNKIWVYPGLDYKNHPDNSIIVMPEWYTIIDELVKLKSYNCYGVCSDYVSCI